jgi:hypothetical protein
MPEIIVKGYMKTIATPEAVTTQINTSVSDNVLPWRLARGGSAPDIYHLLFAIDVDDAVDGLDTTLEQTRLAILGVDPTATFHIDATWASTEHWATQLGVGEIDDTEGLDEEDDT